MKKLLLKLKNQPKPALLTAGLFLVLIFSLTVWDLLNPVRTLSENENRVLAKFPAFSAEAVVNGKFESGYETWLNDQFAARDSWVGVKTRAERLAGKRDVNGVYFGADGALLEAPKIPEAQRLADNCALLSQFAGDAARMLGNEHVRVLLAPDGGEAQPQKLPPFAPAFESETVLSALSLPQGVLVDARAALQNRETEYLYYRTDHHWTTLGAYYAYAAWAASIGIAPWEISDFRQKIVSEDFLGTLYSKVNLPAKPDSITEFHPLAEQQYSVEYNLGERYVQSLYDTDKLLTKDQYAVFLGGNNAVVKITNKSVQNGRKLLIVKDSYAHCFAPFAVNHFEETTMVDLRYFNMGVKAYMEQEGTTDVLVLYSAAGFAEDRNLYTLVK